jgi:hypothetical protein
VFLWRAHDGSKKARRAVLLATDEPPTAAAIDDDIYLTVTTAVPEFPGKVEAIDTILTVEYAKAIITQLSTALIASRRDKAC